MSSMITGRGIDQVSFKSTLVALRLEVNTGMRMSRGYSAYTSVKKVFGLKGSKVKVLAQFVEICENVDRGIWPIGYKFRNREDEGKVVLTNGTIGYPEDDDGETISMEEEAYCEHEE